MTRRHRLIALAAAGTTLFSACGSTARTDVVARVDDQELDQSTFETLVESGKESSFATPGPTGNPFDSTGDGEYLTESVQIVLNFWAWNSAFRAELADRGMEAPASTVDQTVTLDALGEDYGAAVDALMSAEVTREWSDAEVEQRFNDLICVDLAVIPPTVPDAEEVAKEFGRSVSSGASLLDLAQQSGYAAQGVGCFRPDRVTASVNGFLAPADTKVDPGLLESLDQGEALDPIVAGPYGFIVLHRPIVEGLADTDLVSLKEQAVIAEVAQNHDFWVDPTYGWFTGLEVSSLSAGG